MTSSRDSIQEKWRDLSPYRLERRFRESKPLLTEDQAAAEADRCLFCYDAPCIRACPTGIDIPQFIKRIAQGNLNGSAKTILEKNLLGYSCGRHCPVEVLCEGACVYSEWNEKPIAIGRLQRYATEQVLPGTPGSSSVAFPETLFPKPEPREGSIALVGSGPASLACGGYLTLQGYRAVLFEKREWAGGLNTWGIASYKFQVEDAFRELAFIESLGLEIRTGVEIGKTMEPEELIRDYDFVFLGMGLGDDSYLELPGGLGPGVIGAVELIRKLKIDPGFEVEGIEHAVVIGGGNTAMDAATQLAGLGVRNVSLVYRRSEADLKAYHHEWARGKAYGVRLVTNAQPRSIERQENRVVSVELVRTEGGRPTEDRLGHWLADLVVFATGQERNFHLASSFEGVEFRHGRIVVDEETGRTGNPRVFSGGDCANGGREVVHAVAEGRRAAHVIHRLLQEPERARSA